MRRHSSVRSRALCHPIMKRICFLVGGILVVFWLFFILTNDDENNNSNGVAFGSGSSLSSSNKVKLANLSKRLRSRLIKNKHRIAIIIPFVGEGPEAVPPYLETFCLAAAGSDALVDFLLIHNGVLDGYHGDKCPNNVIYLFR